MVDDNFAFMDLDERYCESKHETQEEAVERCKELLREEIEDLREKVGPDANTVIDYWISFGESPFVQGSTFSAFNYVKEII